MFGSVEEIQDNIASVIERLAVLDGIQVLVGIPQEKASRDGETLTNAELAFIHTNGSPVNNIPPRPFLQPAIEKNKDKVNEINKQIAVESLSGNRDKAYQLAESQGLFAQAQAKKYITQGNNLAPNKPATIKKKGSDRPLIDTGAIDSGALVNSITYVVV